MSKKILLALLGIGIVGVSAAFYFMGNSVVPRVVVSDQSIGDGQVTVSEVDAVAPSWLVIQTETNGAPGPVVGYTKIPKGLNKNVSVKIDVQRSTPRLFAMIHEDDGIKDRFDFPGNDMPLLYKGEMVNKLFSASK